MRTVRLSGYVLSVLSGAALGALAMKWLESSRQPTERLTDSRSAQDANREASPMQGRHAAPSTAALRDRISIWLVFQIADVENRPDAGRRALLPRQVKEGILCGKVAAALDSAGEGTLGSQVWEQARRILCVDGLDDAKSELRPYLRAQVR